MSCELFHFNSFTQRMQLVINAESQITPVT